MKISKMTIPTKSEPSIGRREAIAYLRVSTDMQVRDGVSLDNQRERIEAYALVNDLTVVRWIVDEGKSGKSLDGRLVGEAIDEACSRQCVLIVYSLSRLSRSLADILAVSERMNEAGADLASLTEKFDTSTAAGRMIFRIFGVLSQFEREINSERTSDALTHKIKKNERVGRYPPYGWELESSASGEAHLVMSLDEQISRQMVLDRTRIGMECLDISSDMNGNSSLYRGRAWTTRDVERIISYAKKRGEL